MFTIVATGSCEATNDLQLQQQPKIQILCLAERASIFAHSAFTSSIKIAFLVKKTSRFVHFFFFKYREKFFLDFIDVSPDNRRQASSEKQNSAWKTDPE